MGLKKLIQSIYDGMRHNGAVDACINFFIARERAYRAKKEAAIHSVLKNTQRADNVSHPTTQAGLFRGMVWPKQVTVGSEFAPKVLGTYEIELQPLLEKICSKSLITAFVDIGAAEGYYAVGLCMLCPRLRVYAYEMQLDAHDIIRRLAEANNVSDRIDIYGQFTTTSLDVGSLGKNPLFLIDAEGSESSIVNSELLRAVPGATFLVEIHDFISAGTGRRIRKLLSQTHKTMEIVRNDRLRKCLKPPNVGAFAWRACTDERRPHGNYWLIASPKLRPDGLQ